MAKKNYTVGEVSFTEAGYDNFKGLSKDEQISYISERLNPKDEARAESLLKSVPNGDSNRSDKQSGKSNTSSGNGNGKDNTEKSTTATS